MDALQTPADRSPQPRLDPPRRAHLARTRPADERRGRDRPGRRRRPGRADRPGHRGHRRPARGRRPARLRRGRHVRPARRARRDRVPADVPHAARAGRRPDRRRARARCPAPSRGPRTDPELGEHGPARRSTSPRTTCWSASPPAGGRRTSSGRCGTPARSGRSPSAWRATPSRSWSRDVDLAIAPVVGPEVLSGSTRLKAGTATKLVLNMLTTGAMVRLGKTFGNLMVDLRATNAKLKARANRIVRTVTGLDAATADVLLRKCDGEVKTALVCQLGGCLARRRRERSWPRPAGGSGWCSAASPRRSPRPRSSGRAGRTWSSASTAAAPAPSRCWPTRRPAR